MLNTYILTFIISILAWQTTLSISSIEKAARDLGAKIAKNPQKLNKDAVQKFKNFSNNFASMMSLNLKNQRDFFASLALIDACIQKKGRNCVQAYESLKENITKSFLLRSKEFTVFSRVNSSSFIEPVLNEMPQRNYLKYNGLSNGKVIEESWKIASMVISAAGPKGLVVSKLGDSAMMIVALFENRDSEEKTLGEMIKEGNANIMERIDQAVYVIQDQLKHYFDYIRKMFHEIDYYLSTIQNTLNAAVTLLNSNDLSNLREPVAILMDNVKLHMKDPANSKNKEDMLIQCKETKPKNIISAYEHKLLHQNYLSDMSRFYAGNFGALKRHLVPLCRDLIILPFLLTQCSIADSSYDTDVCSKESASREKSTEVINGLLNFMYTFESKNNIAFGNNVKNMISEKIMTLLIPTKDHYTEVDKTNVAKGIEYYLATNFEFEYSFAVFVFAGFDIYHIFDANGGMIHHVEWIGAQTHNEITLRVVVFWNNKDNEVDSPKNFPQPYKFAKTGNEINDDSADLETHFKKIIHGHEMKNQNICVLGSVLQYVPIETSRKQINSEKKVASDKIIMSSSITGMHLKSPSLEETQNKFVNTPEIWLRYMPFDIKVTYEQAKKIFTEWRAGASMEEIVKIANKTPRKGSILRDHELMVYNSFKDTLGEEFETYKVEYRPSIVYFLKRCTEDKPLLSIDENMEETCITKLEEAKNMATDIENELAKIDAKDVQGRE